MHDLFDIVSSQGAHPVRMTGDDLVGAVRACKPALVLADSFFRNALAGLEVPVVFVEAVEENKNFTRMPALVETFRHYGLTRDGMIVAVGGGIVQDIACFCASVYMRGAPWTYIPTTLLAMVDSCIGGKSSINVGEFKNLVGTFYPPAAIIVPPHVLVTLPPEHIAAGRAEAAKICFARGGGAFERYMALDGGDFANDPGGLIALSLGAKKWFVETDEFDRGERLLLNFGHSFGHALESCTDYAVPHGVGVGVGCLAAIAHSEASRPALRENDRVQTLRGQLFAIMETVGGLDEALSAVERDAFITFWDSDKKHSRTHYRPILIDSSAELYRASLPRDEAAITGVWNAFEAARRQLAARTRNPGLAALSLHTDARRMIG